MNILSSFTYPHDIPNLHYFLVYNSKGDIWKNVPVFWSTQCKFMVTSVPKILFFVPQKDNKTYRRWSDTRASK